MIRLVALAALLVLSACGGETGGADDAGRADLEGRTFVATTITEGDRPRPLVEGTELRLMFEDGRLGITAGCNHLSGRYEVEGDRLTVSSIGGTEMGCPPPLMDQDAWLADVLARELRLRLADPDLTLTSEDVVIELTDREIVSPDRPLVGTRWRLDSIIRGDAVANVPGGTTATLRIDGRTARVDTGCIELDLAVSVGDDTIAFPDGIAVDVDCPDDAGVTHDAVVRVLDGEATWRIAERSLTITNGDRGLGFRAE